MGIKRKFAVKQLDIIKLFESINVYPSLTCTPYLIENKPSLGDHIAWSESSAVAYANSILGARTNRESGISALAAAIIGKTPYYGMHIKENRSPEVRVKVNYKLEKETDYGVLGYLIGKYSGDKIPWIEGIEKAGYTDIKILSASIGTYAGLAIYHIPNITAEWRDFDQPSEVIELGKEEFREGYEYLMDEFTEPDIVWLGCPHLSLDEIRLISKLLEGKHVKKELWLTTSRQVLNKAIEKGYVKVIEEAGGKVLTDTCIAVAPLRDRFKNMYTNSAKACYYSRGLNRMRVKLLDIKEIIDEITMEG